MHFSGRRGGGAGGAGGAGTGPFARNPAVSFAILSRENSDALVWYSRWRNPTPIAIPGGTFMSARRTWIAAALMFAAGPAIVWAQDTAAGAAKPPGPGSRVASTGAKTLAPDGPFLVKPYLQLGHTQTTGKLVLIWHAADADADWSVEYRPGPGTRWQAGRGPRRPPGRGGRHRAAPGLSRGPDGPGAGRDVRLPGEPGGRGRLRGRGPRPEGRPTSRTGSSSSATAGPARPSRRRSPTGPSWPGPTS